ncbi:MAG: hypothetical protein ACLQU9_02865 [Acidimicrobiales bacterium]|jgi:hypothetical protein
MPGPDVPSTNGHRDSPRRVRKSRAGATRTASPPAQGTLDEQVVTLRETGKSYTAVARALGIKHSGDAHAAFLRALQTRPAKERAAMTQREGERLDRLERRVRSRDVGQPDELRRHLAALEKFRQSLA